MIGILPAAGNATRIHGLPKYLLPVPGDYLLNWHIQGMQHAGLDVKIGTNPATLGTIHTLELDANLYLAKHCATMTQTVISSGYLSEAVVFGMPDTYWSAPAVYQRLAEVLHYGADVAVALFETRPGQHSEGGMCSLRNGYVVDVIDKPEHEQADYRHIWGALAWTSTYWQYLEPDDPHVGYGLNRAIEDGLLVQAVHCKGNYWDCGTPQRYFECIRHLTEPVHVPAHRP